MKISVRSRLPSEAAWECHRDARATMTCVRSWGCPATSKTNKGPTASLRRLRTWLRNLIERLDLRAKLRDGTYTVRLVYVTNALLDSAGRDFVVSRADQMPLLDIWDRARLVPVAERTKSLEVQPAPVVLPLASDLIYERLDHGARIAVALVRAIDLVELPGIDNLSIFELNVRVGLGRTRINRELKATIDEPTEHAIFPAYHNGLTVLTRDIQVKDRELILSGISVGQWLPVSFGSAQQPGKLDLGPPRSRETRRVA